MTEIKFRIDGGRYLDFIDWELQCAMEEAETKPLTHRQEMQLAAAFLVNEQGEYYSKADAYKVLGRLTLRQKSEASDRLLAMIRSLGAASQSPLASQTPAPLSTSSTTAAELP
jgi:hypothetical protein